MGEHHRGLRRFVGAALVVAALAVTGFLIAHFAGAGGGDIDRSFRLFWAEERVERGVLDICVDGAGGLAVSDAEVGVVKRALDPALAGASHVPGAASVERELTIGCPPPLALTGEPKAFRAEVPARWLGPDQVPSPHVLFVYFVAPQVYAAEFPDLPDFIYFSAQAELRCERDIGGDPANLQRDETCFPVTDAIYLPPSPDPDVLLYTIQDKLGLIPPGQIPTPDWYACELGTPWPWCERYDYCASGTPEPSCEEFWQDIGMEPPG